MSLLEELKRRNVFRIGIAYLITAWLLLQVVDLVLENIGAPDWVMQTFMLAVAVGFPLALFIAWAFEMTPEGLRKEKDVDRTESITLVTGRKLDRAIIGVMALALAWFAWDKFSGDEAPVPSAGGSESAAATAEAEIPQTDARRSIAVLPFANRSSREEDAFFADGIHDDLLTSLAKVGALKVISRTSVMRYRDSGLSIPEIANELGVSTVMEGGIQRSANQVRINVQLIDARTDEHLWAENYDRELTAENLFAIQSEISREIVTALQATLTDAESQRLTEQPTDSLEAYGEFVLGRQELARRTNESLPRATAHFEKAIELDPEYTLAYVGLADSLALQATYGDLFVGNTFAPRQAAIDKALALDPNSGEAYASLGLLRMDQNQNEASEGFFKKAIEFSPNYATAWHWYSFLLNRLNRYQEALPLAHKAIELDPNAPILTGHLANLLVNLGRTEEAIVKLQEQLQRNPEFPGLYGQMAGALVDLGRLGEAMRWAQAQAGLDATSSFAHVAVCAMHVQLGADAEAEACFDRVEEAYPEASFGQRITLFQLRGQMPESLALMRAIAERFPGPGSQIGLGYNLLSNGDWAEALALVERNWPRILSDDALTLGPDNYDQALMAAFALHGAGETDRADVLFEQSLEFLAENERTRGLAYGALDVFVHAYRGERRKAIAALREAIDSGWREDWFRLRYPLFDHMLAEPEWVELLTELEADIAAQRRWYEENQDEPLF